MNPLDTGEIYKLTCPKGKVYIGQCVTFLSNGTKYGTRARWINHQSDARRANGGNCRRLNEAIRAYGEANFKVETLLITHVSLLDIYEEGTISLLESTNPMHGYNLRHGGNHSRLSLETRLRMRQSRLNCSRPKHSKKTKEQISKTLIDNVIRYDVNGKILPKYVKFINWTDRTGYAIVSHPKCKIKYFVSKSKTLEDQYNRCGNYLALLG